MYQTNFINKTPSANIQINVKLTKSRSLNLLQYENKSQFEELCMLGCPNYGKKWSCPPYSPSFSKYKDYINEYPNIILVLFWCTLDQFYYTKTDFIKIKASNSILKSRMDRYMRTLEQILSGITISNGSCRLCNPCNKKIDGVCKKPKEMRFSMESLGLNVEKISKDFFDHNLLWYKNKKVPLYTSVISCLLTKNNVQKDQLENIMQLI